MSNAIVKNLSFGDEAKNNVFKGIDKLTKAVSSTLGAKKTDHQNHNQVCSI